MVCPPEKIGRGYYLKTGEPYPSVEPFPIGALIRWKDAEGKIERWEGQGYLDLPGYHQITYWLDNGEVWHHCNLPECHQATGKLERID